ncbi:hypothetical protein [Vibrio anguillarum]|uniref:hypothetical protein n=2 Tax=Vibrio anguillarum TaxID=55601 RepID=UPI000BB48B13|nr:hypothetical protein [Vibrio anguillarum]ATC60205.1 hypothetical protein CMV05_22710 [Vibrio anguillarum]MBF4252765.1 hypothetical protein [Vibrio anguillarum]MBF4307428.1 hypothetical protein [Vibrio anguillarum]MBF4342131.1 hypothetical protein [Vibrio anguillarum]
MPIKPMNVLEKLFGNNVVLDHVKSFTSDDDVSFPIFPGYVESQRDNVSFLLPKTFHVELDAIELKRNVSFDYADIIEVVSLTERIPDKFSDLKLLYLVFGNKQDQRLFLAELQFVFMRFLLSYKPSAVEVYQSFRRIGLSCSALWHHLPTGWRYWSAYLKSDAISMESYTSFLLCSFYAQHQFEIPSHTILNLFNRTGINKQNTYLPSVTEYHSAISSVTFRPDQVAGIPLSHSHEWFSKYCTSGIDIVIDGICYELSAIDAMQAAIGTTLPSKLSEFEHRLDIIDSIRSLAWEFFWTEPLSHGTASHILFAFKIQNEFLSSLGLKCSTLYKPMAIEKDELVVAHVPLIIMPWMVLLGRGAPMPYSRHI